MIDFYDFIDNCRNEGLSGEEALSEYERAVAEEKQAFMERYENDPEVQYGWYQQDVIDMYRYER